MFRRFVILSIIALAVVGTAAGAQRGRGVRRGAAADRVLNRLQKRLSLSETQMNGVRALQENRRKEMESLQQELRPKRQALRRLLQQPNPNPNEVGNATLAVKETRERMQDINQRFASGLKQLLTPEQLQQVPKRLQK